MKTKLNTSSFGKTILTFSLLFYLLTSCQNHSIINTFIKDKNIFVTDASGSIKQITFNGKDSDPKLSPDSKTIYFVRETGKKVKKEYGSEELLNIMKINLENSKVENICDHIIHEDWVKVGMTIDLTNDSLTNIENLSISGNGDYLFFETKKWVVSYVLVKLDTKTMRTIEISPSDRYDIIKEGEFKDKIIVKKSYFDENPQPGEPGYLGRQWSNWLIDFDGKELKKLGDENAVIEFLGIYYPKLKDPYKKRYNEYLKVLESIRKPENKKAHSKDFLKDNPSTFRIENSPPIWSDDCVRNSTSYFFPFEHQTTFKDAVIYFERKDGILSFLGFQDNIFMRFRVSTNNLTIEELRMKDTPEMLVKLGDGTILTGRKERLSTILLNAQYFIDVYFNLNNEIQKKILKYGIEKVRIAYVFEYMGLNRDQIFDAYTKDCIEPALNAGIFLEQVLNADIKKAKQDAEKNGLNSNF